MPRIDPIQLLKCLSVLLSSSGGIRSKDEVQRLASLMTKFSKKLVSKCIYILILKTTEADLLDMFMSAGGWDLTFNWLSDGINSRNWPLVVELVELLLLCPVDIERLKGNNCPKLIKQLSKEVHATEKVRMLACNVVEQWLAVVKAVNPQPSLVTVHPEVMDVNNQEVISVSKAHSTAGTSGKHLEQAPLDHNIPIYKITIRNGKKVLAEVISSERNNVPQIDNVIKSDDVEQEEEEDEDEVMEVSTTITVPENNMETASSDGGFKENSDANNDNSSDNEMDIVPVRKPARKTIRLSSDETPPPKIETVTKKTAGSRKVGPKKRVEKRAASPDYEIKSSTREKKKNISPDKKLKLDLKSREKIKEKNEKSSKDKQAQEDKDKAVLSLSKLITPSLEGIGKIPKKSDKKKDDDNLSSPTSEKDKAPHKKLAEPKKPPPKDPKKYNISIETRKGGEERPKTVKTFNSKFRSTGLEEPPPPPKGKKAIEKKDDEEKKPLKRSSPVKDVQVPEKKHKEKEEEKSDKSAAQPAPASTPSKPKTLGLQESDVFADALTAANPVKDVKKRKRRISNTSSSDSKKSGSSSPTKTEDSNTSKPVFKFYQDTLITSDEKKPEETKAEVNEENKSETESESRQKSNDGLAELEDTFTKEELEDEVSKAEEIITEALKREDKKNVEREKNRIPKGVLVYVKKRRGPKKSVQWKPEKELETIKFFELDETERVNVTKTFTDMKQMEVINERMLLSRKLAVDDIMEEKTSWRPLIPIDIEGDLVTPGKNSVEKEIQQARERTTLQAIYFNRAMIPDSPAEPDLEIHATTEPAIIPLDDQSGNTDSVLSYKDRPWPEPKGYPPGTPARQPESPPQIQPPDIQEQPPMMIPPGPAAFPPGPFPPGPFPMPPNMMPPAPGPGGCPPPEWMQNGPDGMMGPPGGPGPMPGGPMPGPMPPGMMMGPPEMFGAPGGMPPPEFMGPPPPQFMGPPHPGMFGPPPPNFPPNNGPPPHVQNDVRPTRPWFRQNNGPPGGSGGGGGNNGGGGGGGGTWRHPPKGNNNSWKSRATCKFFLRKGFCHVNKCQFNHNIKKNNR